MVVAVRLNGSCFMAGLDNRSATDVDREVGLRIRTRRSEMGLSQSRLAAAVGVTCHQIQKYESGRNRIGVGRLTALCGALNVTPDYFIGGTIPDDMRDELLSAFLDLPESADLMTAFVAIDDRDDRLRLLAEAQRLGCAAKP
jgi:transcriptional regulator with XRE-family HTH domain